MQTLIIILILILITTVIVCCAVYFIRMEKFKKIELQDGIINQILELEKKQETLNDGDNINHMQNVLNENIKLISNQQGQRPPIGQIVPIWIKYLQWESDKIYDDINAGIRYYVLGKGETISNSIFSSTKKTENTNQTVSFDKLMLLYNQNFNKTNQINLPYVIDKAIIGGLPIIETTSQNQFDKYYRNVLAIENDIETGKSIEVLPNDVNVRYIDTEKDKNLVEDQDYKINSDYKIITKNPQHSHKIQYLMNKEDPKLTDYNMTQITKNMQDDTGKKLNDYFWWGKQYPELKVYFSKQGVSKYEPKTLTTANQTSQKQKPINVSDPGTQDIRLCLVIDYI